MSECLTITANAENYESAIVEAMIKLKDKIDAEAQVHRTAAKCEEMRDWYVDSVEGQLSAGDVMVQIQVTFALAGSDL